MRLFQLFFHLLLFGDVLMHADEFRWLSASAVNEFSGRSDHSHQTIGPYNTMVVWRKRIFEFGLLNDSFYKTKIIRMNGLQVFVEMECGAFLNAENAPGFIGPVHGAGGQVKLETAKVRDAL